MESFQHRNTTLKRDLNLWKAFRFATQANSKFQVFKPLRKYQQVACVPVARPSVAFFVRTNPFAVKGLRAKQGQQTILRESFPQVQSGTT